MRRNQNDYEHAAWWIHTAEGASVTFLLMRLWWGWGLGQWASGWEAWRSDTIAHSTCGRNRQGCGICEAAYEMLDNLRRADAGLYLR